MSTLRIISLSSFVGIAKLLDELLDGSMIRRMSPVKPLSEILAAMQSKNESDIALVSKAYAFAEKAHADQKRYSGEPYF